MCAVPELLLKLTSRKRNAQAERFWPVSYLLALADSEWRGMEVSVWTPSSKFVFYFHKLSLPKEVLFICFCLLAKPESTISTSHKFQEDLELGPIVQFGLCTHQEHPCGVACEEALVS